MVKLFLFLFHIFLSSCCFSQSYINVSRSTARKWLHKLPDDGLKRTISEIDSTLIMIMGDSAWQPLNLILHFDKRDKCDEELRVSNCDSCFRKFIQQALEYGNIKWIKLNTAQYISAYPGKLLLEIKDDGSFSYTIRRIDITRKQYDALVNN
jgi:hypothetical protein